MGQRHPLRRRAAGEKELAAGVQVAQISLAAPNEHPVPGPNSDRAKTGVRRIGDAQCGPLIQRRVVKRAVVEQA